MTINYSASVIGTANTGEKWSTAVIGVNASYAGLKTQLGNGSGLKGNSVATILAGTATSAAAVTEQWRTATATERLISDVVDLNGVSGVYALALSYDPATLASESSLASSGGLYLAFNDNGNWVNAGNTGVQPVLGAWNGSLTVGLWGIDTQREHRMGGGESQQRIRRGAGADDACTTFVRCSSASGCADSAAKVGVVFSRQWSVFSALALPTAD